MRKFRIVVAGLMLASLGMGLSGCEDEQFGAPWEQGDGWEQHCRENPADPRCP